MNRLLLLVCLLLTTLAGFGRAEAQALPTQPVDSIVAVVEDQVILRSELDRAIHAILAQYSDRKQQLPPQDVLEKQVLDRLVLLRLQLERAEQAGIRVGDAEIEQTVERIAQQNGISVPQLRAQLERDGLPFDEFRQTLRDELTAQHLRQSVIQSRVNVSDTEIDILLASDSLQKGKVHPAQLLVGVPDNASQEQIEAARQKIEGIRGLIERGEMDFQTAAIRYSDAPNALEGGDLGWRRWDEVPPMFVSVLQGMKADEVSPPVRAPNGFIMIKLLEANADDTETATEYHARGILISPDELQDREGARAEAEALRQQIANGGDFAELAREHSDDTMSRNQGGDMGWFQQFAYGNAVGNQIVKLEDNELSPVFESDAGFHILQRLESRQQDVTDEVRRAHAREAIARRKSEDEYERFLHQLRDEAFVEIRLKS